MTADRFVRPARLRPGDRVAIVGTSSPIGEGDVDRITAMAARLGLDPVLYPSVTAVDDDLPFLSGSDRLRAHDLTAAWCDDAVRAVWASRGGYGAGRMLDLCDWAAMATAEPKVLLGYSDATCVHEAVAARLGVATLHAPMPASVRVASSQETVGHLRSVLFDPDSDEAMNPAGGTVLTALMGGSADGWLTGGNLSVLSSTIGSSTQLADHEGALVFLEEVNSQPYQIDRNLTTMLRAGWFNGVTGVVLGGLTGCGTPADPLDRSLALGVFRDRLAPLGVPVAAGLPVGHDEVNHTLPLGIPARLDATQGTLHLVQPALA
jgi:muramoyltetrapeptide carboxypeptidase